jgi:hypothetical protein
MSTIDELLHFGLYLQDEITEVDVSVMLIL